MLHLEIVTPERRVLVADVDSVTVPTATGEAGILPSHAPLISALKPGILAYSIKGTIDKLAVSGGFVEVSTDRVSVLVDTAETAVEIDADAARLARDSAEKTLLSAGLSSEEDSATARAAFDHAAARLQLVAGR